MHHAFAHSYLIVNNSRSKMKDAQTSQEISLVNSKAD